MFHINEGLLAQAKQALSARNDLYWVVGGSASGKTTVSRAIAAQTRVELYDMDSRIYGAFSYDPARHPVNTARNTAANPLDWALCLSAESFNAFGRATTVEYLDLMVRDLPGVESGPILIDGGITHPSLAAEVIDPGHILCLQIPDLQRKSAWLSPERVEMAEWVRGLPNPDQKWQTFLAFDQLIADVLLEECLACGIRVIDRQPGQTVAETAEEVTRYFSI